MKTLLASAALLFAIPVLAHAQAPAGPAPATDAVPMVMADGAGTVTALDPKAGVVTIHHGPIAKLSWPAMTMAFKATDPAVLQGVKVGQSVKFQLMQMGSDTQLTAIAPK
jgi:Cu(I)/Ag(I) efflux system protein CusF